jgi:integrase
MPKASNKRRLNNIFLKGLGARAAREKRSPYLIWHEKMPGLALQVRPSGRMFWKVIYRRHRRPRWFTIGEYNDHLLNLGHAEEQALNVLLSVKQGRDPQDDKLLQRSWGTLTTEYSRMERRKDQRSGEVETEAGYLVALRKKNKSWPQTDKLMRNILLREWGNLKPAEVSRGDVKRLLDRYDERPSMRNALLAAASGFFSYLVDKELLAINPCHGVKSAATKGHRTRHLQHDEVQKFWRALDEEGIPGLALRMVLVTSARPGEVSLMRTEHVSADGRWWEQPGDPVPELGWRGTKNHITHRVFLPEPARAIIKEIGADGFVFGGPRGGPVVALDRVMRRIYAKLEIPEITPHDLRRSWATFAGELEAPDELIERALNHSIRGEGKTYNQHKYDAAKQRLSEAVAARIMALVQGRSLPHNVVPFASPAVA